jgi:hypothetical protein
MLKGTVTKEKHQRDLSELEGNLRTLLIQLESKLSYQEGAMIKMEKEAKKL